MAQFLADGSACNREHTAEIRLHQNTDRVSTEIRRQATRRGPNAAFPAEDHRPGARTDIALLHRTALCVLDGGEHVVGRDVAAAYVAQVSVIGFADNRIDREHLLVARQGQHIADQSVGHARHACGRRQKDGRFDVAHFLYLRGANQLSETIAYENRAGHFLAIEVAGVWQNGRHTGADVVAANDGLLPDFDTGNIGDRIERPDRQNADLQPQVGGARACIGSCALGSSERDQQEDRCNSEKLIRHAHRIRPESRKIQFLEIFRSQQRGPGNREKLETIPTDEQDLQRLGYAQQLLRGFGGFSNFGLSFSVISLLTGAVTLFDYGLSMGGPREMLLGWPLVTFGTLMVALSMAELCSALPTSGGMYHWSAELGGPTWAWFTAWLNIVGLITAIAGTDYGCAEFLAPMLGLQSGYHQLFAVYTLLLLSQRAVNHYSAALVAWLSEVSVVVHIVGVTLLIGSLMIFAPKHPVAFLWSTQNLSPVKAPYAWLFMLGLLQAQWTYTGFDASAHVAEETTDPRRHAPWGIVMSVVVSGIFGYLLVLSLALAIPNLAQVLQATDASGHQLPAVLTIVRRSLGVRASAAVLALTVLAMWFCGLAAITSVSRSFFALARDNGMPLASTWSRVRPGSRRRYLPFGSRQPWHLWP